MNNRTIATFRYGVLAMIIALTCSQPNAIAQDDSDAHKRTIEGVWRVKVMPRNCTTGVPIPTAAFEGLYTFHRGGTMSAWAQNATITTTRSPSHGLWQRTQGWSDYSFKFVHLRYSLATGAFIGSQESTGNAVLAEGGDDFTAEGSTTVLDVNGIPTASPGCSNTVGTRFKQ